MLHLPTMIVFDLDDCLWTPEMHELSGPPTQEVRGSWHPHHQSSNNINGDNTNNKSIENLVLGVATRQGETVKLYEGARQVLYELATNQKYQEVTLAVASSSLEPSYSKACLERLEILPGQTLQSMIRFQQIGRSGNLTPRKTSHFAALHEQSGIPYEEMLFFDDCNWGDHVGDVENALGVMGQRTPNGLQWEEFWRGMQAFAAKEQACLEALNVR